MSRCVAFATDHARRQSVPLSVDARLAEIHFGAWEGRSAAELMASDAEALERFWRDPVRHTPPGGEPLAVFAARVREACRDIAISDAGRPVLMVTHGGVIRTLLCQVEARPLARMHDFEVGYGSLHRIRLDESGRALRCDETRHA